MADAADGVDAVDRVWTQRGLMNTGLSGSRLELARFRGYSKGASKDAMN